MNILILNPGSSSLKYRLFRIPDPGDSSGGEKSLADGNVDHVGGDTTAAAAEQAVRRCLPLEVDALGFRVVHGGGRFLDATRITPDTLDGIRELSELAPLHNPIAVAVIEAAQRLLPAAPAVAVFDTAFHRTLPEVAIQYALPFEMCREMALRRYGFHGISHQYVSGRLLQCLGRDAVGTRLITLHLGNGASVCALQDGKSVDTSMGLTPMEGLVMGTRCGDVDPGLLLHLLSAGKKTVDELSDLLNHKSGLLGLSGQSSDTRDLEHAAAGGDARAELALAIFAYRVRKYIGAYAAALGGLDAVAFTGGIGEHSAAMRSRICEGLAFLGMELNSSRNEAATGHEPQPISAEGNAIPIWVVPTDEEKQIARESRALLDQWTPPPA